METHSGLQGIMSIMYSHTHHASFPTLEPMKKQLKLASKEPDTESPQLAIDKLQIDEDL